MDYFRKYLSNPNTDTEPSGADIVERLVERVQSSTLIEDRQDALRAIKSLSKKYRLDVGTQAMHIIMELLENDKGDRDIAIYCLDILYNILNDDHSEFDRNASIFDQGTPRQNELLGKQFTEMLMKSPKNIECIVSFLDETDFAIRRSTMHLITLILKNRTREVQDAILMCPMAVSKIMDILSDVREIIRNDCILLLQQLTFNNTNIQKIVAFENAFERIVLILREEGYSDGGVVIEDCLRLLWQLLKNNPGNQTLFKEGNFIQKLITFFELSPEDTTSQTKPWSGQKIENFILMLQVLRTLISPSNKFEATYACQKILLDCRLLHALCSILMASGIPAEVLTETIHAVAEAIRGYEPSQQYMAGVMAPSQPPEPAINVLLMSMVNERQPFPLRQSVLYCLQCFLYKNDQGQKQIVETLLPKTVEESDISTGQLLCSGLFSQDPLSVWFASIALSHAIHGNIAMKEEMLRVHLAISLGSRPIALLHQLSNLMSGQLLNAYPNVDENKNIAFQAKVGILTLLCTWLHSCPSVVHSFLLGETDLTSQFASLNNQQGDGDVNGGGYQNFNENSTISQRSNKIGSYVSHIMSELSTAESEETDCIIRGLCALLLSCAILNNPEDVKGFESSTLIHIVEKRVGRNVFMDHLGQIGKTESFLKANKKSQPCCKKPDELIFDYEFTLLYKRLDNDIYRRFHDAEESKLTNSNGATLEAYNRLTANLQQKEAELTQARGEMLSLQNAYSLLYNQYVQNTQELQSLRDQNLLFKTSANAELVGVAASAAVGPTNEELSRCVEQWQVAVNERDERIVELERQVEQMKLQLISDNNAKETNAEAAAAVSGEEFENMRQGYNQLYQAYEDLRGRYNTCEQEKIETRQEHEELLVLLADQDTKVKELKQMIISLGGHVDLSEEEEEEDVD